MNSTELLDNTLTIANHVLQNDISPEKKQYVTDLCSFVMEHIKDQIGIVLPTAIQLMVLCPQDLIGTDTQLGLGLLFQLAELLTDGQPPIIPRFYDPSAFTLSQKARQRHDEMSLAQLTEVIAQEAEVNNIIPALDEPWECSICMASHEELMSRLKLIYRAYGNKFWFLQLEDLYINCELVNLSNCVGNTASDTNRAVTLCISCLEQHCQACFAEARTLTCPCSCGGVLTEDEVRLGLRSEEQFKTYLDMSLKTTVGRTVNCLTPDCTYFVEYSEDDIDFDFPQQFECPICQKSYCLLCEEVWSSFGHVCPKVLTVSNERKRKKRACPECGVEYVRISGCPHMTCRCGAEFCDKCNQPYDRCNGSCDNSDDLDDEYDDY